MLNLTQRKRLKSLRGKTASQPYEPFSGKDFYLQGEKEQIYVKPDSMSTSKPQLTQCRKHKYGCRTKKILLNRKFSSIEYMEEFRDYLSRVITGIEIIPNRKLRIRLIYREVSRNH